MAEEKYEFSLPDDLKNEVKHAMDAAGIRTSNEFFVQAVCEKIHSIKKEADQIKEKQFYSLTLDLNKHRLESNYINKHLETKSFVKIDVMQLTVESFDPRSIVSLRLGHGLTQKELSQHTDMEQNTISKLENGLVKKPHPKTIYKIIQFFQGLANEGSDTQGKNEDNGLNSLPGENQSVVFSINSINDSKNEFKLSGNDVFELVEKIGFDEFLKQTSLTRTSLYRWMRGNIPKGQTASWRRFIKLWQENFTPK